MIFCSRCKPQSHALSQRAFTLYACWTCARNTLEGRYMRAQCRHLWFFVLGVSLSHTHWKLIIFCQSVGCASVVLEHSLLVLGAHCTNATHIFVRTVIGKGSWVCSKYWTHIWMHKCTRQKTARNTWGALEQRYINAKYVCFVSHGCPLRTQGSRGQRACPTLHERPK